MGWWPSIFGGDKSASDPLNKLDPELRKFLEKESPVKYHTNSNAANNTDANAERTPSVKDALASFEAQHQQEDKKDDGAVPTQSLYQDGRYAHLWKNYRPQAQVEAEAMTEHDKLMSVLDGYNERKSQITRAAMENCAEAQEEWINCMKFGEWKDQLQMCRHQVRSFEKCYTMQSRFLRALGYGSTPGRPAQIEEDIQMHADALYQRVLKHEDVVKKAKEEGLPAPVFDPSIPRVSQATIQPTQETQEQWNEQLQKLPESERAAEEAALRADLQAKSDVAKTMKEHYESQRKKKSDDPKVGEGGKTLGDALYAIFTGRS